MIGRRTFIHANEHIRIRTKRNSSDVFAVLEGKGVGLVANRCASLKSHSYDTKTVLTLPNQRQTLCFPLD